MALWGGVPFPPPVDHVLSELSAVTCLSRVALQSMARRLHCVMQAPLPQQGSDPRRKWYCYTSINWPVTTPHAGKGVEQQELFFIAGENLKWYTATLKESLVVSYKTDMLLPYGSSNNQV